MQENDVVGGGGGGIGVGLGATTTTKRMISEGKAAKQGKKATCHGLKNKSFMQNIGLFSKHFEYQTSPVNSTVRPITLDFLGSDDELDEGIMVKSSNACTNSIKLWKNSSFMSKTTASPPRRSPNTSDDRDIKMIENGIKVLPAPSANNTLLQVSNPLTTSYSYHSGMSTALLLHSPIDKSFKQDRFQSWLRTQQQSVSEAGSIVLE